MSYKIIDNYLSKKDFQKLKAAIFHPSFPWYYHNQVVLDNNEEDTNTFFCHPVYDMVPYSKIYDLIHEIIITKINPKAIRRIKINLYPRTENIIHHKQHVDYPFSHKNIILYLNTCNGFTVLEDGTKIESIENRALFFDSSTKHHSTTCTDKKIRLNININYF